MRLQARNAWLQLPDSQVSANVAHLDATLVDRTPQDPLTPLALGSYDVHVRAGEVKLLDSQATELLRHAGASLLARHGVRDPRVTFLSDGRVRVAATAVRAGLPLPVALDFRLAQRDGHTVALVPAFSWLTRLGLGAMGLDLMKGLAAAVPGSSRDASGGITLDLRTLPQVHADLQALSVRQGHVEARLGAAERPPGPREGASNWVAIETRGDVSSPQGVLRNGKTFSRVAGGPDEPILLNELPRWVNMRRDAGEIVLDRDALAAYIAEHMPELKLKQARFDGQALELHGHYQIPIAALGGLFGLALGGVSGLARGMRAGRTAGDLGVPVTTRITLTPQPDGRARLTPAGEDILADAVRRQLTRLPGARVDGEGVLLDLSRVSGVDLGPLRRVHNERGRLVLGFDRPSTGR
jgi:hypothetical protein